jgi:hypothetical protein
MATIQQLVPCSELVHADKVIDTELCKKVLDAWPDGVRKRLSVDRLMLLLNQLQVFFRSLFSSAGLATAYTWAARDPNGIHAQILRENNMSIPAAYLVGRGEQTS